MFFFAGNGFEEVLGFQEFWVFSGGVQELVGEAMNKNSGQADGLQVLHQPVDSGANTKTSDGQGSEVDSMTLGL